MNENLYNCIYLTAAEFILLAGASGIEQMDGIFRKPVGEFSDVELRFALARLCSRGLLKAEEGRKEKDRSGALLFGEMLTGYEQEEHGMSGPAPEESPEREGYFQADSGVSDLFGAIRDAGLTAMFFAPGEEAPCVLAYLGERTAALQVSRTDENAVRVFLMTFDEFAAWMKEEGCLPPDVDPADLRLRLEMAGGLRIGDKRLETFFEEGLRQGDGKVEDPTDGQSVKEDLLRADWLEEEPTGDTGAEKRPCLFVRTQRADEDGRERLVITDGQGGG